MQRLRLVVVIVTLLCPGSPATRRTAAAEEEPLIDQIAMEAIDKYSAHEQSPHISIAPPPVAYTGFKINPNCKCGKSPYDGIDGNPHPWTAAIFYKNPSASAPASEHHSPLLLFCTGSLINDRYVLTASRCVQGLNASDLQVWLSEKTIWSDQQIQLRRSGQRQYQPSSYIKKSPVEKVIIHPDFDPSRLNHEIALLQLADPVKLSRKRRDGNGNKKGRFYTTPICLPKYDLLGSLDEENRNSQQQEHRRKTSRYIDSLVGTVVSWDKKGRTSYSLVQSRVPFVNGIEKCQELTNNTAVLNENMLCAGKMEQGANDSCWMDTGSPLVIYEDGNANIDRHPHYHERVRLSAQDETKGHYTLVGVSTWLYGCTNLDNVNILYDVIFPNNTAKPQVPGVYAKIERYRDWITHNTLDAVWCA